MITEEMLNRVHLWLVRHGETVWNANGRLAGWSDVSLTPKGEQQAKSVRPLLKRHHFDSIWSSDLVRAVETARLAYGEPVQETQLREINFGDLEGCTWESIDEAHRETLLKFDGFAAPGGESLEIFGERIRGFVDRLGTGRHLIFTHGGVIRLLTWELGLDRFVQNGDIVVVDWSERKLLSAPG